MKCKRAKQEMALHAGRDLDSAVELELQRHLASCPSCHEQWKRIRSATAVLHQASLEEAEVPPPRLWSAVSRSIQATPDRRNARSQSFSHGFVPLVAVASLLLAVVSINHSLNNPPPSQTGLIPDERNTGVGRAVDHPVDHFQRQFLDRSVVPPPQPPIKRMLRDQSNGYQQTPTPQKRRIDSLPGGVYVQEE